MQILVNFLSVYLSEPFASTCSFHRLTRGEPCSGCSVHIWSSTSRKCSIPLFNTSKLESPIQLQQSKQSRSCATNTTTTSSIDSQTSNSPTSSPSASTVIRLITTIACDHTGGDNQRCSSSAGYLDKLQQQDPSLRLSSSFLFFYFLLYPRLIHTCVFTLLRTTRCIFFVCNYLDTCALSCINVGLNITAMTGKLAEKLPLTMSSLINTIPDSLYPEEDIPTSMNIFTNTESINHYSQMNTGKIF